MKKRIMKKGIALLMVAMMTCAMAGCGSSKDSEKEVSTTEATVEASTIKIATKPMTEQYILGEMLKLVIEKNTDYTVEITKGIGGGTNNIMRAMEKGEFDLYPEYSSSGYVMVLGHDAKTVDDETIWNTLREEYKEKYDMSWVGQYGFNNTYAVIVRNEVAEKYKLSKTSDLAAVAGELIFGGNADYIEREDGLNMVCETYGLTFKEVKDIDIGLKYEALNHGDIDVSNGFTTDAQLGSKTNTVLEDDKHLQVNYFCSTVVRNDCLESHPGLEEAILLMNDSISDEEMSTLNYAVEVEGKDEASVAKEYLASKGIVKE